MAWASIVILIIPSYVIWSWVLIMWNFMPCLWDSILFGFTFHNFILFGTFAQKFCNGSDKLPPMYYDFSIPLKYVLLLLITMFRRVYARKWDTWILFPNGMGWRELLFFGVKYMQWDPRIIFCFLFLVSLV